MNLLPSLLRSFVSLAVTAPALVGCYGYDQRFSDNRPSDNRPGDLSFLWTFDGETSCFQAGVFEVEILVLDDRGRTALERTERCVDGGLILHDFFPGNYTVRLDAFARDGRDAVYSGDFDVDVLPNVTNDVGELALTSGNPQPLTSPTGSAALFWRFAYPTVDGDANGLTPDCRTAGVTEVDVKATPRFAGGQPFAQTFSCDAEGTRISDLAPGAYDVTVDGFGSYHGQTIPLYQSAVIPATVAANNELVLGDVDLAAIDTSFAQLDIDWGFAAGSCAGVGEIEIEITRSGLANADDRFAVDCASPPVLRGPFVPGSYTVTAIAAGTSTTFDASLIVDADPSVSPVAVPLALVAR